MSYGVSDALGMVQSIVIELRRIADALEAIQKSYAVRP